MHEGEIVAVGGCGIHGVERLVRGVEPGEQAVRSAEEEEIGVDDQLPAGGTEVRVDEFANIGVAGPPVMDKWILGGREMAGEVGGGGGFGGDAEFGEEAAKGGQGGGVKGAVVVKDGSEAAAGMTGKRPEAESGLIPEAAAGEEMKLQRTGIRIM